jgi:hypothetical protein
MKTIEELKCEVRVILDDIVPKKDRIKLISDINKVMSSKSCLKGNDLCKNMAGLGSLWGYFPHFMDVKVGKMSLADKMTDPKVVEQIIEKTAVFCMKHEGGKVSRNRVFQSLKAYNGHHVSNFRPVAARDIYDSLIGRSANVFDPCSGWGGRLIGAIGSGCKSYVGVDASAKTVDGFKDLIKDGNLTEAKVVYSAIEDFEIKHPFADIAFTSPPYFDAEKYSDDETQSWKRYGNYDKWREGFLMALCEKMKSAVDDGGYVVINIADVKGLPICEDTNKALKSLGLTYVNTYRYILSSIAGKGQKFEPVFIYKK